MGSLGAIITLFLIGKNFLNLSIKQSVILGVGILIALFVLRYLYFFGTEIVRYVHNTYVDSIWGKAIIDLKDAYSEIHYLRRKDSFDNNEFLRSLIIFCDTLKKIFDRKTKSNCCVSIKVPVAESDNLETLVLRNLCRDTHHKQRDTDTYKSAKHTVIGNTPYRVIVNKILKQVPQGLAYINNDIDNSKDYENTSRECYDNSILPYKSEFVYPIIPIKNDDTTNYKMCGFICIDCEKKNKFDEARYDIPMIEGIADGIYDLITRRNK